MTLSSQLSRLYERMSSRIDQRKGIQLSADDVELLTAVGVYDALSAATARELRLLAQQRIQERTGYTFDNINDLVEQRSRAPSRSEP